MFRSVAGDACGARSAHASPARDKYQRQATNLKIKWRPRVLAPALALLGLCIGRAQATGSPLAALNIDVTISGSISVQVDNAASSTYTAAGWSSTNRVLVSASTATVINDSGGLNEQWYLATNAASINTAGNAPTWSLVVSTNIADVSGQAFALQAVFVSSAATQCPVASDSTWASAVVAPALSTDPALFTSTQFADTQYDAVRGGSALPETASNNTVWAYNSATGNGRRGLCWRFLGPNSAFTPDTQNIQVIVTAVQAGTVAGYVTPGAFCAPAGATGYSASGVFYTCKTSSTDSRNRWRQ